jgi:hypothetical protein
MKCTKLGKKLLGSIAGTIFVGITLAVVLVVVLLSARFVLPNCCCLPGQLVHILAVYLNGQVIPKPA